MKKIVFAAVAAALMTASLSSSAASGKAALSAFVQSAASAQGAFEQKVADKNGSVAGGEASGTFVFERPGKFLWKTELPYPQTIVSDAKTVSIWDPDLNQVTVRRLTEAVSATPAAVLFGRGDLEKTFVLADLPDAAGLNWVSAQPRVEDMTYKRFEIGFDADGVPAEMRLFDHFGQTVTIAFKNVKINAAVEPSVFQFRIPEGADILQDTH